MNEPTAKVALSSVSGTWHEAPPLCVLAPVAPVTPVLWAGSDPGGRFHHTEDCQWLHAQGPERLWSCRTWIRV